MAGVQTITADIGANNEQSGTIDNNAGASADASASAPESGGGGGMMIWIILAVVGVLMIGGIAYYVSKHAELAGGAITVKASVKAPVVLPSVVSSSLSSF